MTRPTTRSRLLWLLNNTLNRVTSEIARSRYIIVAGECVVVDHRVEYRVKHIEPCSAERGRNAYPVPFRLVLKPQRVSPLVHRALSATALT